MLDFVVGYGLELSVGDAPRQLESLSKLATAAGTSFDRLAVNAKAAEAAVGSLGAAAQAASAGVGAFDAAMKAASASARAAGSSARGAAGGFAEAGAAAQAAAAAVIRYNLALAGAGSSAFALSAAAGPIVGLAGGRSWRDVGGLSNAQRALPPGWVATAAGGGFGGGGGGGVGAIPIGPGASYESGGGRGGGGGFVPPGGGGPRGPGGFDDGAAAGAAGRGLPFSGAAKWAALGTLAGVVDAVHEAGAFQINLQSIANITGAGVAQMDNIRKQMFNVGNIAAMSPNQASQMFREEARMSQGTMSVGAMQTLLPLLAKAQVVIGATRGYSPEQTTDAMMSYVHLMRLYDPKKMPQGFDLATRFFELIPTAPQQTIRQLSYFVPQLTNLGVKSADEDALMLTLARAGYGQGKGGTGLANLVMQSLGPLQVTSFQQAQKLGLLKKTGMVDQRGLSEFFFDKKAGDPIGMLSALDKYEKGVGRIKATKTFESMFGITGARISMLLANPVIEKQLQDSKQALTGQESLGLNAQFDKYMGTQTLAEKSAFQNFQALTTELGSAAIPGVTSSFRGLADALHYSQEWLTQNKDAEKALGDMVALTTHSLGGLAIGVLAVGGASLKATADLEKATKWLLGLTRKPPTDKTNASTLEHQRQLLWASQHGKERGTMSAGPDLAHNGVLPLLWSTFWGGAANGGGVYGGLGSVAGFLSQKDSKQMTMPRDPFAGGVVPQIASLYRSTAALEKFATEPSAWVKKFEADYAAGHTQNAWQKLQARQVTIASGAVSVHVDARGSSQAEVTKAVSAGVSQALKTLVNEQYDPRHHGGRSGSIVTSKGRPTQDSTPTNAGG